MCAMLHLPSLLAPPAMHRFPMQVTFAPAANRPPAIHVPQSPMPWATGAGPGYGTTPIGPGYGTTPVGPGYGYGHGYGYATTPMGMGPGHNGVSPEGASLIHYYQHQLSPRSRSEYDRFNQVHFEKLQQVRRLGEGA